ncbi:TonB system transport protein ExbD [Mesorhizobium sp. NPDC059025]|uniref:TonB system transport protein ExbD n=1 Tax=unclassified Mesorhizobium TaxID=325217 RepID=UPI0036C52553
MAGGIKQSFDDDDMQENHEINVTPFIDVMLVLLIIFMVAAPLATVDINVDLPASTATPAPKPEEPLYVTLKDDLSLAIGQQTVDRNTFQQQLDTIAKGDKQKRIFLRADRVVAYGDLMEVMNLMRGAGYLKVALVGLETVPTTTPAAGAAQ